jgi:phosphoglycolate phosphatase-like HAD superfamily hydrolase
MGLQEVSTWERGTLGGATTPTYDYLSLLLDALAQRGLSYSVASTATNFSTTMPISATEQAKYTDQDLTNVPSQLSRRIDYVLTKGGSAHSVTVIGDRLSDRTPGGRWPSDHAGPVAGLCVGR